MNPLITVAAFWLTPAVLIAAGFFLLGVVVGIAFLAVCMAWDREEAAR